MNNIITSIAQRIRDEHRKHPDIDWEYIAASKIYLSFIDSVNYTQDKTEPHFFGDGMKNSDMLITEDDVVKGLLKYHDKLYGDNTQPLEEVAIKLDTKYVCVHNTDYFHTDEIIMFDDHSQFIWTLRLIYNTGFSMDIPKETVERMIRTGEIVEHKDTLSDPTNKNDNTVSNIIHNGNKEPSVSDKIIIDTEVYYECIKTNAVFEKGCKMGFSYCDDDILKCTMQDGSTLYFTEATIKQMIANKEIDTPF